MSNQNLRSLVKRNSRAEMQLNAELLRPNFGQSNQDSKRNEKLWAIMKEYKPLDRKTIQTSIVHHLEYTLAINRFNFGLYQCYQAVALSVRDRLLEAFNDTCQYYYNEDAKRVYYLSIEYLLGRFLQNALINLDMESNYRDALEDLGYSLEKIYEEEKDPALGNGGLGRLAACYLDSMATLNYPAWGYGIRYDYGIFKQKIHNGDQIECPEYWLAYGNPWEIQRVDIQYPVQFYGRVEKVTIDGKERSVWKDGEVVIARAYDNPIPGFNTFNCNNLRLWKSVPTTEFDLEQFNYGQYQASIEKRQRAEYITSVLYPSDKTNAGKELRLKQQYFFCCATLQDAMRRFTKNHGKNWELLPEKASIQLNDTHPAIAIVELLRILVDIENIEISKAFKICQNVFSYTNHTVLPEALEKWSVDLIGNLLPRHLELIYEMNFHWLEKVNKKFNGDFNKMSALSIIEEQGGKMVRMASLCTMVAHKINGVAAIHSELIKKYIFTEFYEIFPDKFLNVTNGVTPRRWIRCCNPELSSLFTKYIGSNEWIMDMEMLTSLDSKVKNNSFLDEWMSMKAACKQKLVSWVKTECNLDINPNSLFDIQVKRIHEYKRQFMNALYMIHHYLRLKEATPEERNKVTPRTFFVGGKAAPSYITAKKIIKLICAIGDTVNNDSEVNKFMQVVFMPNYNVSNAQIIIPAAELSQHISTAGTEASGTSNMKFTMNGCLIIGTYDGANIEIAEEIGEENMFIFGAREEEVNHLRTIMRSLPPNDYVKPALLKVFNAISNGMFGHTGDLVSLIDQIRNQNDYYLVCHDFYSYAETQDQVAEVYSDKYEWARRSVYCSIRSAKFNSDRSVMEYAENIWNCQAYPVPDPSKGKDTIPKNTSFI